MALLLIAAGRPVDALVGFFQSVQRLGLLKCHGTGVRLLDVIHQALRTGVQAASRQKTGTLEGATRAIKALVQVPGKEKPLSQRGLVIDEKIMRALVAIE